MHFSLNKVSIYLLNAKVTIYLLSAKVSIDLLNAKASIYPNTDLLKALLL